MSNYTLPTWVLDVVEKHGVPLWIDSARFQDMYPLEVIELGSLIGSDVELSSLWWITLNRYSAFARVPLPDLEITNILTDRDHELVFGTEAVTKPQWFLGKACLYIGEDTEPLLLGVLSDNDQYCIEISKVAGSIKTFDGNIIHHLDELHHYFRLAHSKIVGSTIC